MTYILKWLSCQSAVQQLADTSSVFMPLILFSTPPSVTYSPIGNSSKYVSPQRLVEEHAPRDCMCIVSPNAQKDIDMVIVSTPVKRWCPVGTVIHPSLLFQCGSCKVIGWLLWTWWTQPPNVRWNATQTAYVQAPPGQQCFRACQGRRLIRRAKEMMEKAFGDGRCRRSRKVGPCWSSTVETNRSQLKALFFSPLS